MNNVVVLPLHKFQFKTLVALSSVRMKQYVQLINTSMKTTSAKPVVNSALLVKNLQENVSPVS
jgi:hypothetical protein